MAVEVGQYDFEVYQGNPVSRTVIFKDVNDVLLDFSSVQSIKMQIKKSPVKTAPAILELTSTGGNITFSNGTVNFSWTSTQSDTLPVDNSSDDYPRVGTLYYDIEFTSITGVRTTMLYGQITVLGQVTV
jgi:hypothetical protein